MSDLSNIPDIPTPGTASYWLEVQPAEVPLATLDDIALVSTPAHPSILKRAQDILSGLPEETTRILIDHVSQVASCQHVVLARFEDWPGVLAALAVRWESYTQGGWRTPSSYLGLILVRDDLTVTISTVHHNGMAIEQQHTTWRDLMDGHDLLKRDEQKLFDIDEAMLGRRATDNTRFVQSSSLASPPKNTTAKGRFTRQCDRVDREILLPLAKLGRIELYRAYAHLLSAYVQREHVDRCYHAGLGTWQHYRHVIRKDGFSQRRLNFLRASPLAYFLLGNNAEKVISGGSVYHHLKPLKPWQVRWCMASNISYKAFDKIKGLQQLAAVLDWCGPDFKPKDTGEFQLALAVHKLEATGYVKTSGANPQKVFQRELRNRGWAGLRSCVDPASIAHVTNSKDAVGWLYGDCMNALAYTTNAKHHAMVIEAVVEPELRRCRLGGIVAFSMEWHDAIGNLQRLIQSKTMNGKLPSISGTLGDLKVRLEPVRTVTDLHAEGRSMHNCVASYAPRARLGGCYIYSVFNQQKHVGTTEVRVDRNNQAKVVQIQGPNNEDMRYVVKRRILELIDTLNHPSMNSDVAERHLAARNAATPAGELTSQAQARRAKRWRPLVGQIMAPLRIKPSFSHAYLSALRTIPGWSAPSAQAAPPVAPRNIDEDVRGIDVEDLDQDEPDYLEDPEDTCESCGEEVSECRCEDTCLVCDATESEPHAAHCVYAAKCA